MRFVGDRGCVVTFRQIDPLYVLDLADPLDPKAAGVLQAARRAGLQVPADLTVVGFDDFQIAQAVWPPLTTIHIPTREVGRMAAEKLIGLETREKRDPASTLPHLVVRESSGPAPKV